jgi:hypothetical protein
MNSPLPATGTAQLLKLRSPYVPDGFINEFVPRHRGRGRRQQLNSAQLYPHPVNPVILSNQMSFLCDLLSALVFNEGGWLNSGFVFAFSVVK